MRMYLALVITLFVAAATNVFPQEIRWQQLIEGRDAGIAVDLVGLPGGDHLVVGTRHDLPPGDTTSGGLSLTRISNDGEIIWTRRPELNGIATPVGIHDQRDGSYTIIGIWRPGRDAWEAARLWIAQVDASGALLSERAVGPDGMVVASARRAPGGFIVSGAIARDAFVTRINDAGEITWEQRFSQGDSLAATSAMALPDGGFVVAGWTRSFGLMAGWLQTLTDDGAPRFSRVVGGGATLLRDVLPLSDGSMIVTGTTSEAIRNRFGRLIVARYDRSLAELWTVTRPLWIRGSDSLGVNDPYRMYPWGFGDALVVGRTGPDNTIPFTLKVPSSGEQVRPSLLGGLEFSVSTGTAVLPMGDGSTMLVGTKYRKALVMRIDVAGPSSVGDQPYEPVIMNLSSR
jgi:hypothetical protein